EWIKRARGIKGALAWDSRSSNISCKVIGAESGSKARQAARPFILRCRRTPARGSKRYCKENECVAQTFLSAVSQGFPACESLETGNAANRSQRLADTNVRPT